MKRVFAVAALLSCMLSATGALQGTIADARESRIVKIDTPAIMRQQGQQWCWAASIQNILSASGVNVKQETIVQATWGRVVDLPVFDPREAVWNLLAANALVAPQGKVVHPFFQNGAPQPRDLVREIELEKAPVMVFYRHQTGGHVVVCYGIEYSGTQAEPLVTKVFVKDPATGTEMIWGGAELAGVWLATIYCRVAPKPRPHWESGDVHYSVSPLFDVESPQGVVVGRIWYHKEDSTWHFWDYTGDRGAIP